MSRARAIPLLAALLLGGLARAQESGEAALLRLWQFHERNATNHTAVAKACAQSDAAPEFSAFRPVVRGLMGWHLFQLKKPAEAAKTFETLISKDAADLPAAGSEMAQRWLTRVDRERVRTALDLAYRKELEFPNDLGPLAKLPEAQRPPLTDRWGRDWSYRREGMKHIKGLMGQKFLLQSGRLGELSDLATELARPYAAALDVTLDKNTDANSPVVPVLTRAGERLALVAGQPKGRIALALAGKEIVILTDGDTWKVLGRR